MRGGRLREVVAKGGSTVCDLLLTETSSGLQECFIVLLPQSCFVWPNIDHAHQATSTNDR